jgi:hypothetical protein
MYQIKRIHDKITVFLLEVGCSMSERSCKECPICGGEKPVGVRYCSIDCWKQGDEGKKKVREHEKCAKKNRKN